MVHLSLIAGRFSGNLSNRERSGPFSDRRGCCQIACLRENWFEYLSPKYVDLCVRQPPFNTRAADASYAAAGRRRRSVRRNVARR
ncbi:hypothetical protein J6590_066087 [Homalodisca vitripennis]|nr:hypothetical protein J6590_066087 [Homalodisca vitripennis]